MITEIGWKHMKRAITGVMLAMMAMTLISFAPNITSADIQIQGTWVRMYGFITQWNMTNGTTTNTFGWIVANAAIVNKNDTVHKWAMVHATWSDIMRAYPVGEHPLGEVNLSDTETGNFSCTFSFFTARLLSLSDLIFNKTQTGHDFYLVGYWNVSEITETINITWNKSESDTWGRYDREITITWTDTPVATNATGTLVADWSPVVILEPVMPGPGVMPGIGVGKFELQIDGVGTLSGSAWRGFIWAHPLNICDFGDAQGNPRDKVDIYDLVKVAKHYGEAPGFGNYDPNFDVDGDGKIGIGDLTTVAANIQG
jgi:hypothetical protein